MINEPRTAKDLLIIALNSARFSPGLEAPTIEPSSSKKIGAGMLSTQNGIDNSGKICKMLEGAKLLASLERCSREAKAWAWWAYGPDQRLGDYGLLLTHLEREFCKKFGKSWHDGGLKQNRTHKLMVLAIEDAQSVQSNGGRKFKTSKLLELIAERQSYKFGDRHKVYEFGAIAPSTWARDWAKRYELMIDTFDKLDREAIDMVQKVINNEIKIGKSFDK